AARCPIFAGLLACLGAGVIGAEALGRRGGLPWPGDLVWPVVAGIVLIAAGIGLRAWSIAILGRFFQYRVEVQPGHRVVTGVPYRYLRHPSYTGIALVLAGIALACDDVWSLLAVAVLGGAGLAVRIRAEEPQLARARGAEYERFVWGRKRLVPGVWGPWIPESSSANRQAPSWISRPPPRPLPRRLPPRPSRQPGRHQFPRLARSTGGCWPLAASRSQCGWSCRGGIGFARADGVFWAVPPPCAPAPRSPPSSPPPRARGAR